MFANVANLPAITVPAGLTADGLPIGLMITARRHREDICLRLAHIFEQAAPGPYTRPASPETLHRPAVSVSASRERIAVCVMRTRRNPGSAHEVATPPNGPFDRRTLMVTKATAIVKALPDRSVNPTTINNTPV